MLQPDDIYYDPFSFEIDDDPYPVWARMLEEAPLYRNDRFNFYALTRFDDVIPGLADTATYLNRHGTMFELLDAPEELVPDWILFKDPPEHTRLRSLVSLAFTPRRIAELESRVKAFAGALLDRFEHGDTFDLPDEFARRLPMLVISSMLGVPDEDMDHVQELFSEFSKMQENEGFDFSKLEAVNEYFRDLAEARSKDPKDDMMTALLNAEITEDGAVRRLTEKELSEFIVFLDGAGTDTVALTLGNAARDLEAHSDQRALLAAEPERIPNAVEEILRYDAPSPVQCRLVARDVEHHGEVVPAGSKMLFVNGASTRDPRHYPDPDRFDVTRTFDRHLSFGFGAHHCLGAALARLEARVALEELLVRFPEWHVHLDEAERFRSSAVRGYRHLPITV